LADALGWEQFSLVGHSIGGMAIQWLAAQAPKRILAMTGITPVPASGFPMDAETEALFRGAKTKSDCRQAILMHTTGNRLTPMFGKVMAERSLAQTTPQAFDDYLTAWSQTVFLERVAGLTVPFQVLVGEADPAVTELLVRDTILKWFPNASLTVISNAGHYPMLETPLALVTLWEAFLAQKALVGQLT
jgi:pimeloyl-ACP methyl ester carboxylesterase